MPSVLKAPAFLAQTREAGGFCFLSQASNKSSKDNVQKSHSIPEFDSLHPWQAKSALNKAPDMEGSGESIAPNRINELIESCEHVVDAGNDCVYVGIHTMLELAFVPYQPTLSLGGSGGSSDKKGWNDDDKYQRRHSVYRSSKKSGSLHR